MAEYEPTSHRPIAPMFRRTADGAVNLCVRLGIPPDAISYSSILAAIIASLCFLRSGGNAWLLIFAPLFCYLRLWFNMLDGMVALAAGKASARGEIVNDLPDRISDVIIFAGVAHSGLMNPVIGYWAAILSLFAAYVGLFGQALGRQREFGGIMSKPWRMVALSLGAWAMFVYLWWNNQPMDRTESVPPILDWTCLAIIAGCLQTIIVRLKRIVRRLQDRAR
jgi:phosphatidylglycerophosphate synthase